MASTHVRPRPRDVIAAPQKRRCSTPFRKPWVAYEPHDEWCRLQSMAEIKAQEGSMIEITALIKKGQYGPEGVGIGHGVRITPGPQGGIGMSRAPEINQVMIDVEGWRPVAGTCTAR